MIDITNTAVLLELLRTNGYWIIFVLMFIEGPIITYIAAFASALGIFNIYWVFILSILGNQIPDLTYHFLGRVMRLKTIEKFLSIFGFDVNKVIWIERHLKTHPIKTIIAIKLIPIFPGIGLFLTGFTKVPFKKFIRTTLTIDLIASFIFCILGFYSGIAIDKMSRFLKTTEIVIPFLVILIVIFYFVIKFISGRLVKSKTLDLNKEN